MSSTACPCSSECPYTFNAQTANYLQSDSSIVLYTHCALKMITKPIWLFDILLNSTTLQHLFLRFCNWIDESTVIIQTKHLAGPIQCIDLADKFNR